LRKIAVIDKNPQAHFTQWRAIPDPKKFFHNNASLVQDIKDYNPDLIFINKGVKFTNIIVAIADYKSVYFYGDYYRPVAEYVKAYAKACDVVLLTNKNRQFWSQLENDNIFFVHQGVDVKYFHPVSCEKKHDIVFAANYFGPKFIGSDIRLEFARHIKSMPYKTLIVGNGWPKDIEAIPRQGVLELNNTLNESRLTAGMSHFIDVPYYTSNRLYQCMATGVPHIAWHCPGVENIFNKGYIANINTYEKFDSVVEKLLCNHELRLNIGMQQFSEIRNHHTIFDFWQQVERILDKLWK